MHPVGAGVVTHPALCHERLDELDEGQHLLLAFDGALAQHDGRLGRVGVGPYVTQGTVGSGTLDRPPSLRSALGPRRPPRRLLLDGRLGLEPARDGVANRPEPVLHIRRRLVQAVVEQVVNPPLFVLHAVRRQLHRPEPAGVGVRDVVFQVVQDVLAMPLPKEPELLRLRRADGVAPALVVHMQQENVRPARFDELLFHKVQQAVQNEVLLTTVIELAPLVGRHRLGGHERATPLALARLDGLHELLEPVLVGQPLEQVAGLARQVDVRGQERIQVEVLVLFAL